MAGDFKVSFIKTLFNETLKGKSLGRTLLNLRLSRVELEGRGLDLGAKSDKSSYYQFISIAENTKITFTDINPQSENVIKVDLEHTIPVPDNSQDFLLLMNVLEHLFDYKTCLRECARILKPKGRLIGCVPFLHRVHPDPDDNFRFTNSSLGRILREAGFGKTLIEPLGFGPVTAGVSQYYQIFKIKSLIFLIFVFAIGMDRLLNKFFKNHPAVSLNNFPLVYFFIAEK